MSDVLFSWIIPTLHVVACLFLIVVVLLQTGKGADMGAVFGGGSQTLFGSGGAGNFLTRLTTATAILFMVTSLVLTYGMTPSTRAGILDKLPSPAAPDTVPAPQAPAADAGAGAPVEAPVAVAPEAGQPAAQTAPPPAPAAPTDAAPATGTPPAGAAAPALPAAPAPAKP